MNGHVSIAGDIYSYGILLLEMFIGKRPTDEMFKDDLSIHKFVLMAFPDHIMDIIDPSMFFEEEKVDEKSEAAAMIPDIESQVNTQRESEECLVSVMRIGVACSAALPRERMAMNSTVNHLQAVRDSFLKLKNKNTGRMR